MASPSCDRGSKGNSSTHPVSICVHLRTVVCLPEKGLIKTDLFSDTADSETVRPKVSGTLLGQYFSSVKKRVFIWDETHLHHQQCLYILFRTSWINHYSLWSVQMENTADTVLPSASSSQFCQQTPKHFRDATCCVYIPRHTEGLSEHGVVNPN